LIDRYWTPRSLWWVSRARAAQVKTDWDAWCARSLEDEDIIRVILDGTVVKTRIDRRATNISVLAAIGVRRDGQKVLLSIMSEAGQRLIRGINRPLNGR
jgi:transposase-like protein